LLVGILILDWLNWGTKRLRKMMIELFYSREEEVFSPLLPKLGLQLPHFLFSGTLLESSRLLSSFIIFPAYIAFAVSICRFLMMEEQFLIDNRLTLRVM
jgi:hypothetical protein